MNDHFRTFPGNFVRTIFVGIIFCFRPQVDDGDILELVGCKMFSRKFLKLRAILESLPTALES